MLSRWLLFLLLSLAFCYAIGLSALAIGYFRNSPDDSAKPIIDPKLNVEAIPKLPKVKGSFTQQGHGSYYANRFHGRRTASGDRFDMDGFTAAHRRLPFGFIVKITNRENNTSIVVLINDRGPFTGRRIIDMARGAARAVNLTLSPVSLEGFSPKTFAQDSTLVGFTSSKYDAYLLPTQRLWFVDTLTSFSQAVRAHRAVSSKRPSEQWFLIPLYSSGRNGGGVEGGYMFLIATFKNESEHFDKSDLLVD